MFIFIYLLNNTYLKVKAYEQTLRFLATSPILSIDLLILSVRSCSWIDDRSAVIKFTFDTVIWYILQLEHKGNKVAYPPPLKKKILINKLIN